MSLLDEIRGLHERAAAELEAVATGDALEAWRIKYLGMKGAVRAVMDRLKEVPKAEKPAIGKAANAMKMALQAAFDARAGRVARSAGARGQGELVDVTLPGRRPQIGHLHVLAQTINEICDIFGRMGFTIAYGPEVEDERHNFQALNIPIEHPARDELDNFYIDEQTMLRSQTSTVQIRVMEAQQPPVRIIAPGRVYRPDTVDATHSFMFQQVEGLYVDEGVTMADLKSCLDQFCKTYFGRRWPRGSGPASSRSPNRRARWTCCSTTPTVRRGGSNWAGAAWCIRTFWPASGTTARSTRGTPSAWASSGW